MMLHMKTSGVIKQIKVGPMENFSYLVFDSGTQKGVIIDPGWESDRLLSIAREQHVDLVGILLTHAHFDHVGGAVEMAQSSHAPIYVHAEEAGQVEAEEGICVKATKDGDRIPAGHLELEVIHTPGHTPGSQCFLVPGNLFTGDTLFINACGRCDLAGSDPEKMRQSLKRLAALDENIVVWPGHDYAQRRASTIGDEKKNNPYVRQALTAETF